jgi:hypothetical protein
MGASPNEMRRTLARRVAASHADLPGMRAVLLTGSTALGLADAASDLDVVLYYDSLPDLPALDAIRLSLGGERLLFAFGEPAEGSVAQSFLAQGIKTDAAHVSLSRWREDAADVLVRHNPDSPMQKALSGLMDGEALAGVEVIEELRGEAAYPAGLALAITAARLRFYPPWALREQAADRGDVVYFYELLTGEARNLLHVLCAVNRVYHYGETKHAAHLLARLPASPEGCDDALPELFLLPPSDACASLDRLIRATFDFVERELPAADVAKARARYATPHGG